MIANLQAHYGFTRMPFGTAIPIDALYASAAHKEAVARLRWLISARGLGALTGEVGCGKTVAVRAAVAGLDASRHTLIYLPNPQIGVRGIHGAIAAALGQAPRFHHATLIPQVEAALAAEAEERSLARAAGHRRITPAHRRAAGSRPHAHQPRHGLRLPADHPSHRPAHPAAPPARRRHGRPRPAHPAPLPHPPPALTQAEADGYLRAHLALAGRTDTLFSDDAVRAIHAHARGMPRAINRLAITALLAAYTAGKTIADESSARTAIAEETTTD